MKIGAYMFATDYNIDIVELATAMEDRGFESLFVPEHTHIPASRLSPWPGGGDLPKMYIHTHDPMVSLAFAAAATKNLKIGTGICLVPQHDPIVLAKSIASLDMLSGGRFIFGIGGGWNVDEMENHGVAYKTRFAQMRENILAMKEIWMEDTATFHGDFVEFDKVWSYPKPVQDPHPPILLGGETDYTLRRVVDYCDGWFPRGRGGFDPHEAVTRLKQHADEAGRDMSTLQISVFGPKADQATIDSFRQHGIDRAILTIPDTSRDEVLKLLDEHAKLLD
jgi:probable F420-dependent oxidoreductase